MSFDTTTNLLTLNNEPFPSQHTPSSAAASTSTNDAKHISKLILRSALQKANVAVQCDSTNDVLGAISAYQEAIALLDRVLSTVEKESDQRRLQEIHDSYSERIRLLSTITSKLDSDIVEAKEEPTKPTIPNMNSNSSLNGSPIITSRHSDHTSFNEHIQQSSPPARNTPSTPSPARPVSEQKEIPKIPVSPPVIQMQASKSTPTHPLQHHRQSPFHNKNQEETDNDGFDTEKEGQQEPPPLPTMRCPPRHQDHRYRQNSKGTISSTVSSVDSMSPSCSSSEEEEEEEVEENLIVEQPAMTLPSLKKKDQENTPIPKVKSVYRARTSSLPKAPSMQRSSSMSTVDTIASTTAATEEDHSPTIAVAPERKQSIITIDTTPTSLSQQQTYPPQMIINRPIISRPSVGGLGSMRKKAANRLSMDGFAVVRVKEKLSSSPSTNNNSYGFFLKDQIKPASANDLDYMMDDQQQQQQIDDDNHSSMTRSSSCEDTSIVEDKQSHLKLLLALEKSMLEGAHITQKLYIPKNLWHQPNIRLSSMDIKVSACESLMNDITRLENWAYMDDLVSSTRILEQFETSVDQLQINLSKKLKRDSTLENSSNSNSSGSSQLSSSGSIHHSHSRDSMSTIGRMDSGKKTQSFMSWGTKLTKSVERMNAFSLTKTEDQYKNYIDALQKLFAKIHVLENWLHHYTMEKKKSKQQQYDILLMKLVKICTVINNVIGGFVIGDITVLLAKWLKRGGSWVNE